MGRIPKGLPWVALAVLAVFPACSKVKHQPGAAGLKALFESLRLASQRGDAAKLKELYLSMLPTRADLADALRPPWAEKVAAREARRRKQVSALESARFVRFLGIKPERTQINVFQASTEELLAYKPGTQARSFAGGNRRVAQEVLKPGKQVYAVEMKEPSKPYGVKYQILTFTHDRWVMLGKLWRVLPH